MTQRFSKIDWVGLALWVFRAIIIFLVIYGIIQKVVFDAGVQYTTKGLDRFPGFRSITRGALCPDCPGLHDGLRYSVHD